MSLRKINGHRDRVPLTIYFSLKNRNIILSWLEQQSWGTFNSTGRTTATSNPRKCSSCQPSASKPSINNTDIFNLCRHQNRFFSICCSCTTVVSIQLSIHAGTLNSSRQNLYQQWCPGISTAIISRRLHIYYIHKPNLRQWWFFSIRDSRAPAFSQLLHLDRCSPIKLISG